MEAIEGETSVVLKTYVDVLLDKLDSTEFIHNFRTTKLQAEDNTAETSSYTSL
jgi:hypothetical protein